MDNEHRKRNFTSSDDAQIRQQPVTLKRLATMLRTNQEALMRRADELAVSLVISDQNDEPVDTRLLSDTDRRVRGLNAAFQS